MKIDKVKQLGHFKWRSVGVTWTRGQEQTEEQVAEDIEVMDALFADQRTSEQWLRDIQSGAERRLDRATDETELEVLRSVAGDARFLAKNTTPESEALIEVAADLGRKLAMLDHLRQVRRRGRGGGRCAAGTYLKKNERRNAELVVAVLDQQRANPRLSFTAVTIKVAKDYPDEISSRTVRRIFRKARGLTQNQRDM